MERYVGDFDAGDIVRGMFNTRDSDGAPAALLPGSPLPLIVFRDDFLGHDLSGLSLEVDHGSPALVGLNLVEVDTSQDSTFFANGRDFFVVLLGGTVDGVSVEGICILHFSLRNRSVELDRSLSSHTAVGTVGQRLQPLHSGTAQGGSASTIQFDTGASAIDDFYNHGVVQITGGTGGGQSRVIPDYTGLSRTAAISPNWVTTPDATSVFDVLPSGAGSISGNVDANVVSHDPAALAEIEGEVEDALQAIHLDHLLAQPYDASSPVGDQTSLINRLVEPDNGSPQQPRFTTTALEQAPTGGGDSAATIADAVLDELIGDHTGSGSVGERLGRVPNVAAGANGGLPTVDGSNRIAGIQGTINTLDGLDTAQDAQHAATQALVTTVDGIVDAILVDTAALNDSALPDSVPSDGSLPTLKQAVYMTVQFLMERAVSGTTVTVKKVDGSSSLLTLLLNDASAPTSITRNG